MMGLPPELQERKANRSYPSAPEFRVSSSISVILNFLFAGSELMVFKFATKWMFRLSVWSVVDSWTSFDDGRKAKKSLVSNNDG
jgi:hypothetical protein